MIRSNIKATQLTPVQELLGLIGDQNVPYSLLKNLLIKYYRIPELMFNGWVWGNKHAIFEHMYILAEILKLAKRTNETRGRFNFFFHVEEFMKRFETIDAWDALDKKEAA